MSRKFQVKRICPGQISDKLEKFVKDFNDLKDRIKCVKKENIELKEAIKLLSGKIDDYDIKFERMEREMKKANISIEGTIEVVSLEKLINDLYNELKLD